MCIRDRRGRKHIVDIAATTATFRRGGCRSGDANSAVVADGGVAGFPDTGRLAAWLAEQENGDF